MTTTLEFYISSCLEFVVSWCISLLRLLEIVGFVILCSEIFLYGWDCVMFFLSIDDAYLLLTWVGLVNSKHSCIDTWDSYWELLLLFFWAGKERHQMVPPDHSGAEDTVRLLLTKYPARSYTCPWCHVRRLVWKVPRALAGSWALYRAVVSSSRVTLSLVRLPSHIWWTDASRKQTSTTRPRHKPLFPSWSVKDNI